MRATTSDGSEVTPLRPGGFDAFLEREAAELAKLVTEAELTKQRRRSGRSRVIVADRPPRSRLRHRR